MTTQELQKLVGKTGIVKVKEWRHIRVEILDSKISWGQVKVLVKPLGMTSEKWFLLDSIGIDEVENRD